MKPRYAKGTGNPPPFVITISGSRKRGTIVVKGKSAPLNYSSQDEFIQHLHTLTKDGIPFSAGGHIAGPADELAHLQDEGIYHGAFLAISWRGPSAWLIHEMVPQATPPWELVDLSNLLKNENGA